MRSLGLPVQPGTGADWGSCSAAIRSYYSRVVRASLSSSSRQADEEDAVFANERRLLVNIVRANVDIVDLRLAVLLSPVVTVDAIDPNPGATP
jgi:hypothetical protein